ncbi:SDR family NAD(P)-dependent oxidoreductase [Nocardioides zeae]
MTKTILITGASSGLGAEMARQFAALGHDLALCARRLDRLESLRDEIVAAHPGRRVEVRELDVTDDDAVAAVVADLAATFGHLDRVVVNAGLGKGRPSARASTTPTARPRSPTSSARSPRPTRRSRSSARRARATS